MHKPTWSVALKPVLLYSSMQHSVLQAMHSYNNMHGCGNMVHNIIQILIFSLQLKFIVINDIYKQMCQSGTGFPILSTNSILSFIVFCDCYHSCFIILFDVMS